MKRLYAFIAMWLMIGSTFAQVLVNETFENGNTVGQAPSGWICDDNGWKAGITIPDDNEARGRKPHTGDWYIVEEGPAKDIFENPREERTRQFLKM